MSDSSGQFSGDHFQKWRGDSPFVSRGGGENTIEFQPSSGSNLDGNSRITV